LPGEFHGKVTVHGVAINKYKIEKSKKGEGVERREPLCTVGGNVNWYSHYREQ